MLSTWINAVAFQCCAEMTKENSNSCDFENEITFSHDFVSTSSHGCENFIFALVCLPFFRDCAAHRLALWNGVATHMTEKLVAVTKIAQGDVEHQPFL